MRIASRLLISTSMALMLTAAAIAVILSSTNLATIANAQQQEEQPTSQPAAINNATTAQIAKDSFRVQVPEGWVIHDVNNTGFTLISEVMQGYGILAQLCPEEQQQQQTASPNVVSAEAITCQEAEEEIIHIIRYPNLGAILEFTITDIINDFDDTADTILSYQMQKLREVGYSDIRIVNNTDTRIPVDLNPSGTNNNNDEDDDDNNEVPPASLPAKLIEMTYRTNASSAPSEIKKGYYLLTASHVTPQDLGTMTGYSIFYEGASSNAAAENTTTPAAAVRQVFNSFELIAAPEIAETILAALAAQEELEEQAEQAAETTEGGDDDGDDGDGGDGDDGDGGDPPAGDPPAGDPPAGDPPAGDPPAGDPPAGDPPAGDPPAGDPPAGDPPAGDPPAGDPPAGDPPAGDPPAGDPPAGINLMDLLP